jgi:uncharacterized protein (TIGR02996 family)
MNEEQAFLDHLKADPSDDVTRLVYADWLEERGDPRGAWLRAEHELAATSEDDPRYDALDLEVGEQSRQLDSEWLAAAGRRWDVWLDRYQPKFKIWVLKAIRTLTGCGLAEGKSLSEAIPCRVVRACQRSQAETARDYLLACRNHPYPDIPHPFVIAAIRPCADPEAGLPVPLLGGFDLMLVGERAGKREALVKALQQILSWQGVVAADVRAAFLLAAPRPYLLRRYTLEEEAHHAVRELEESAVVEVRHAELPPLPVQRLPLHKGKEDVWLLDYPIEKKIAIIRAYQTVTGAALGEMQRWIDQALPLLIVAGVDQLTAGQVCGLFAGLGTIQVQTRSAP